MSRGKEGKKERKKEGKKNSKEEKKERHNGREEGKWAFFYSWEEVVWKKEEWKSTRESA